MNNPDGTPYNPAPLLAAAQVFPQVFPAGTIAPQTPVANAFINMGPGPFKDNATIASGNSDAWYNSRNPQILNLFGGTPSPQQQADFSAAVMQRVQQTFQLSGVPVTLTSDPNAPAAHTLSLVSNSVAQSLPTAIGMSYLGSNGLSFIDQQAQAAGSIDQLEWIAAHNISHELMLAFGVKEIYDQSGQFLDARNALWSMMSNPSAMFSPDAIKALNLALAQSSNSTAGAQTSAQVLDPRPVPEPATVALWTLGTLAFMFHRRVRNAG